MRKTLVTGTAVASAVALGACSGAGIGGGALTTFDDAQALAAAAQDSTAEQNSSSFTFDMDLGIMTMTGSGEGVFDGADSAMSMLMDFDMPMLEEMGGGQAMAEPIEMRLVDEVAYVKIPQMDMPGAPPELQTDPQAPWMAMPLDASDEFGEMMQQGDPTDTLDALAETGEITGVQEDGELDGEPVTRYTIDVDFQRMMEESGMGMGEFGGPGDLGDFSGQTLPVEVWLNEDALPMQVSMEFGPFLQEVAEQEGEFVPEGMDDASFTLSYSDWGEPVSVEAPPEDQISETLDAPMPGMPMPN